MWFGGSSFSESVTRGLCIVALVVGGVAATGASAAEPCRTLVLAGGATVEVADAQVSGSLVTVTRLDGRRVLVPADRVDLEASGLVRARSANRLASGRGLAGPGSPKTGGTSGPTITDANVGHVDDGGDAAGSGTDATSGGGAASVRVSGVEHVMSDSRATVSGTVSNFTGSRVDGITIEVTALAEDRSQLGHALTSVGSLAAGASQRFSVPVDVTANPFAIRVFVNAPVERVVFDVD